MNTDRVDNSAVEQNAPPDVPAWKDLGSHLRLWPLAAAGLVADLWSKAWAFNNLPIHDEWVAIPGFLKFQRSFNTGALFGLGKGLTSVFILASLLALGFVLFLFCSSTRHRWSLHLALGLVLAGAMGNLYDRAFVRVDVVTYAIPDGRVIRDIGQIQETDNPNAIKLVSWPEGKQPRFIPTRWNPHIDRDRGVVRDFIRMHAGRLNIWPWVFNLADVFLVVGVGVLMLNFWQERKCHLEAQAGGSDETPSPAERK